MTGAISYPLIILVTAIVVLVFMVTVIVPMFEQVYARMGGEFPRIYDRKLYTLVRVGEETNRLEDTLQKQGEDLTRELEHNLKQLGNLLEPALPLGVSGFVAIVLKSMYLPMFKLGGVIG